MFKTKKILVIIGTRPECIKLASVIKEFRQFPEIFDLKVVSTGQHKELLNQMLAGFDIKVDICLNVMEENQRLASLTSLLFSQLDRVFSEEKPDWVLAQGDTTSVFVASVVSFYQKIKFGHIEAGLRSSNKLSPFPEEFNRRVSSILATVHFAPTEYNKATLIGEGVLAEEILVTGNTVIDAVLDIANKPYAGLLTLPKDKKIILVTAHRRENFIGPMDNMFEAIKEIALEHQNTVFIFPVHLNPYVKEKVNQILGGLNNVSIIPAVSYDTMIHLMKNATLILTDSGGIQEEAPSFGVPVLVMRDCTERVEGLRAGVSKLIGTKKDDIIHEVNQLLKQKSIKHNIPNPYGDGRAAERIVEYFLLEVPAVASMQSKKLENNVVELVK